MSCAPPKKKRITKNCFCIVGNSNLYYKNDVLVDFKPLRKKKELINCSILPTFTNDRKYFTSAFTLPSQKMENDKQLIEDHERRVQQLCTQIDEIYVPKPRSKSKYCGVCRGHYQDYKCHIQSQTHIINLRESNYQGLIHKFCDKFQAMAKINDTDEVKNLQLSTSEENQQKNVYNILLKTAVKINQ